VKVFVESNFVLELALSQAQSGACAELLDLAEAGTIELVLPAFSLAEPYHTLGGRSVQRRELADRLDSELKQLSRTATLTAESSQHHAAVAFLAKVNEEEVRRHEDASRRLIEHTRLLPLNGDALRHSWSLTADHDMSGPDAVVLASILLDLSEGEAESLFLNRNAKDFEYPDVLALLRSRGCRLITSFVDGLARIKAA